MFRALSGVTVRLMSDRELGRLEVLLGARGQHCSFGRSSRRQPGHAFGTALVKVLEYLRRP
jgi:hypothetical protein